MDIIKELASLIKIDNVSSQEIESLLTPTIDASKGDYTLPCFRLAKVLKSSPVAIANGIASGIVTDGIVSKVESVNGYLNFYLNNRYIAANIVGNIVGNRDNLIDSSLGQGKTICIDYSSINIAKPFHIGHLGTTAIGSSLYKIYSALGYKVVGINHLGDYGTQFGKMIVAYKLWGDKDKIDKEGVNALQDIYVRFHQEEEHNPGLTEQAREWFVKIEQKDEEALQLFNYFKDITLKQANIMYKRLNVTFDSWNGESFYNDKMQPIIDLLQDKGLLVESQGAQVVNLDESNMPPCLIVKGDGATLYATRDLAAAIYRKETYDFYKCLYVVAYQQNLHFKQIFAVLKKAGFAWADDLVHVAYGMVSLADGAMSTRKGNVVKLEDVIDKAVDKALQVITEKNPSLVDKEQVAEQVGVGAVIFSAISNARIKDIVFDFDRILSFEGETAPYIQYTHARACSLLSKAGMSYMARIARDNSAYDNDSAKQLVLLLNGFNSTVVAAGDRYEPSIVSRYLIDVCQAFNKWYNEERILDANNLGLQNAKLALVEATKLALKQGLTLLGIQAPEQM